MWKTIFLPNTSGCEHLLRSFAGLLEQPFIIGHAILQHLLLFCCLQCLICKRELFIKHFK